MNTVKKTDGFTLLELIIVIAILAILSCVAVVGYSAYIDRANDSNAEQFMANIYQHAVLANAKAGGVEKVSFQTRGDNVMVVFTLEAANESFGADFQKAYGCDKKPDSNAANTEFWVEIPAPAGWESSEAGKPTSGCAWPADKTAATFPTTAAPESPDPEVGAG